MDTKKTKRVLLSLIALLIVALLIAGTYAWMDYTQHKTNEFKNLTTEKHDVRLIENFQPVTKWSTVDAPVTKEIRVKNAGTSSDFDDVYVRIQLKEYMQLAPLEYEYSDERYALDLNGDFVAFDLPSTATEAELEEAVEGTPYEGFELEYKTDAVTGVSGWFVKSGAKQINGEYGKFIYEGVEQKSAVSFVSGVERASSEVVGNHNISSNGECAYTVHNWLHDVDDCENGAYDDGESVKNFHDFVKWYLGEDIIAYSDWIADGAEPVRKWIYDDTSGTGWVYWGKPLAPGETTTNLLEKVKLINQPVGEFYYAIHADMQAVSLDELAKESPEWTDAPNGILNSFLGIVETTEITTSVNETTVEETTTE